MIDVVRVVEQQAAVTLSMPGELEPYEMVAIYPKVTGFVKSIRVDRGSNVRVGDLIAVLDAPELAAHRSEGQSKLQAAEAQLGAVRSKADADAGTYAKLQAAAATPGVVAGNDVVLAQKAVEADQNEVAAAQQNVEAARQALNSVSDMESYLRVTAPFDGVITERNVHPGALVGPNSGSAAAAPMVRIVQTKRLRLIVPVPQAYLSGIKQGTTMTFSVSEYPGQVFSGTVARIAQTVEVKTRTMAVELDVANGDGRLTSGTFCQVQWPVRRPVPSLFVPNGSVASTTGRTFVVRIRNGRTEWVNVSTGLSSGALIEIFGDLQSGDQVAARGTDELKAGTTVRTREIKPAISEQRRAISTATS
ncbi:MAG TPA: efflux RND transporter periplasmic adaptor subunit [Vicinamibacterales bacterium]|jgi:RND family efflux transporter MFP subunit